MNFSSVLFICLGNICRSPLAEGVFRHEVQQRGLSDKIIVDSAGTGGWHVGDPPDHRSIDIAAQNGIDISAQTCRRLHEEDFFNFDVILGMDRSNLDNALAANNKNGPAQVKLFTEFAGMGANIEIADPFYGGKDGFEQAYQMIKQATVNILDLRT